MKLDSLMIAIFFAIASMLVVSFFIVSMYTDVGGYNVSLSADNRTYFLRDMQTEYESGDRNSYLADSSNITEDIFHRSIGQSESTVETTGDSEFSLIRSAWASLTGIPRYLDVFQSMFSSLFNIIGLGNDNPIYWFISISLVFLVGLALITAVLSKLL